MPDVPPGTDLAPARVTRPRAGGLRLRLISLAAGTGLVVSEATVRWLDVRPRPMAPLPVPLFRLSEDPVLRFEFRPGFRIEGGPGERHGFSGFEINSWGFRDRERALRKPPGTVRILVLGDSLTAGNGVPEREALFTARLERALATRDEGPRYEVLNLGVGGYQPLQEVETLRTKGLAFEPDHVVLVLCVNDFRLDADGDLVERLRQQEVQGDPVAGRSWLGRFLSSSRLAFVVYHRLRNGSPTEEVLAYESRFLHGRSPVEEGLRQLARLAEENRFDALVVLVPALAEPFERYRLLERHARAAEEAERAGVELIDLLEPLSAVDPGARSLTVDGLHLNEAGHAALASILEELLERRWP